MAQCMYDKLADMHFIYSETKENGHEDVTNSGFQRHCTFSSVDRRLRKTGSFSIPNRNAGLLRNARTSEMEERVLARLEAALFTSTQGVAYEMGISQPAVWRFVHEETMHPYNVQRV
ncbi:hypothetical protein TNIN_244191 [Trichonephila inaurata madagascariensis]|uniref:Uncharacterized protein n=1 Tax=Trichonephila inaurata madagascariensis TaxID=2747483 RepID=A0A8X6YSF5_9ARAC|nr:hypothetical protein TNIN_244191 [Trichonephila inaurata madagascariensis]